eukprot:136962_1
MTDLVNFSTDVYAFCFQWYYFFCYRVGSSIIFHFVWHSLQYTYYHCDLKMEEFIQLHSNNSALWQSAELHYKLLITDIFEKRYNLPTHIVSIITNEYANIYDYKSKQKAFKWYLNSRLDKYKTINKVLNIIMAAILYIYLLLFPLAHIGCFGLIIWDFIKWVNEINDTETISKWNQYLSLCVTLLLYHPIIKNTLLTTYIFDMNNVGYTRWHWPIKTKFYDGLHVLKFDIYLRNIFLMCLYFTAAAQMFLCFSWFFTLYIPGVFIFIVMLIMGLCLWGLFWAICVCIYTNTDPNSISKHRRIMFKTPNMNFLQVSQGNSYICALLFLELSCYLIYFMLNTITISIMCFYNGNHWTYCFKYAIYGDNCTFNNHTWSSQIVWISWILF